MVCVEIQSKLLIEGLLERMYATTPSNWPQRPVKLYIALEDDLSSIGGGTRIKTDITVLNRTSMRVYTALPLR